MKPPLNRIPTPRYRHVAWCYDALATAYSWGAIDRAKAWHHRFIQPGDRVLYAGAGRGREITGALQLGAAVTCIEPCPAMASKLHRRLSQAGENFTLVPRGIQAVPAEPEYDLVVSHFFFNVFAPQTMPTVLDHLARFVRPGGRLIIADFHPPPPDAPRFRRFVRAAYYRPVNLAGWLLGIGALHPIYDYARPLTERPGFVLERTHASSGNPATALYHAFSALRTA